MDDEKQVPYIHFEKTKNSDGEVSWKRFPVQMPAISEIVKLAELSIEDARKLSTEEKKIWLWLKIEKNKHEAGRGNEIFSAEPIILLIERRNLFRDSFEQFRTTEDLDLRRDIKIHFVDEVCQDAGGLIRDWFSSVIEELFDPERRLFVKSNTKEMAYLINEHSEKYCRDHLKYFYFSGQVIAKALFEKIPVKAYLNKVIIKQLLDEEITIQDVKYCDVEVHKSLKYILDNTISAELELGNFTFTKKEHESGI